jgi:hypothetical protein
MPTVEEIIARRARARTLRRRRRIVVTLVVVALAAAALVAGYVALRPSPPQPGTAVAGASQSPATAAQPTTAATPSAASPPASTPSASPSPSAKAKPDYVVGGPAPKPPITQDYIDFGARRQAEMAAYALQHYGSSSARIDPKVVVVHYTCGSEYASAHATFESDAPNMGVKPGVVSQFVIDKDGTIYQQIPLEYMGRHTVGLNYVAFGIECVQECNGSDARVVSEIMHRQPQEEALVALIRWLMYRYHIPLSDVIGHGTANDSPFYKDLKGWTNDHTDWSAPQVDLLHAKVKSSQ